MVYVSQSIRKIGLLALSGARCASALRLMAGVLFSITVSTMAPAYAQQTYGNEVLFERTPTVEELNALFAKQKKPKRPVRKIFLGAPPPTSTQSDVKNSSIKQGSAAPQAYAGTSSSAKAASGDEVKISMLIQFDLNSVKVKPEFEQGISNIASVLEKYKDLKLEVGGHADATGGSMHNQDLSKRRAESVRQTLINVHSIAEQRVLAVGYGETVPLQGVPPKDPKNRRVTFRAYN
ncbi:MAG: OmpA family protein [Rhodospirillales bacterium]|nr:OmpA family protein [Rhodospirillales bacterium]